MNTVTYYQMEPRPSEVFHRLSLKIFEQNPGIKDEDVILQVAQTLIAGGRDPQYVQDAFDVLCGTKEDDLVKYPNELVEANGEEIGHYIRTKYIKSLISGSKMTEDETIQCIFDDNLLLDATKKPLSLEELKNLYQARCKKNIKPINFK